MSTSTPVQVYLAALDESVTPEKNLAWDAAAANIGPVDAVATVYVKTSDMKNIFWFGTDSIDVSDGDVAKRTDLNFYLNYPDNVSCPLFDTNAFAGMMTSGMIGGTNLGGVTLVPHQLQVPQDYARYIAHTLFGIYSAVDIFNNESEFAESLYSVADAQINDVHNKLMKAIDINNAISYVTAYGCSGTDAVDASGSWADMGGHQFVTNNWSSANNLGFQVLKQLEAGDPMRFTTDLNVSSLVKQTTSPAGHSVYKMPFRDGDSISFKATITPNGTQVSDLLNFNSGLTLADRVYQIKYLLVSDSDYDTVASISGNGHANNVIDVYHQVNNVDGRYLSSNITPVTDYSGIAPALP